MDKFDRAHVKLMVNMYRGCQQPCKWSPVLHRVIGEGGPLFNEKLHVTND